MLKYIVFVSCLVSGLAQSSATTVSYDRNILEVDMDAWIIPKNPGIACTSDESLNLRNANLQKIPEHLLTSKTIKSIDLSENSITDVPESMLKGVPRLECLNLARNRIPFERMLSLKHDNLKTLILDHQNENREGNNEVSDMTSYTSDQVFLIMSQAYLPSLEDLHLSGISFERFQKNMSAIFPRLRNLYLTDNGLQFVYSEIFSVLPASMRHLHLERNNLKKLDFTHLGNIESLYLDNNPITEINIQYINNNLKLLSLANCPIKFEYVLYRFPRLRTLDLSFNGIITIFSDAFNNSLYLENLSLSHNYLSTLPYMQGLRGLQSLSLSYNQLQSAEQMTLPVSLRTLNLRGNRIASIDARMFMALTNLEELDLSKNMLASWPADWSMHLHSLRYLNLRFNMFHSIHDIQVGPASNLTELYVAGNPAVSVDLYTLQQLPERCVVHVV